MPTGVSVSTTLNGGLFVVVCNCLDFFGKANNFFDRILTLDTPSLLQLGEKNSQKNGKIQKIIGAARQRHTHMC